VGDPRLASADAVRSPLNAVPFAHQVMQQCRDQAHSPRAATGFQSRTDTPHTRGRCLRFPVARGLRPVRSVMPRLSHGPTLGTAATQGANRKGLQATVGQLTQRSTDEFIRSVEHATQRNSPLCRAEGLDFFWRLAGVSFDLDRVETSRLDNPFQKNKYT
jgi:hypothetical protein